MRVVYVTKAKHRDCSHTHRAMNFTKTIDIKKAEHSAILTSLW